MRGGGGWGGCPFSPADVSPLVQTAAEMNQEGCCCYFIAVVLLSRRGKSAGFPVSIWQQMWSIFTVLAVIRAFMETSL